MAKDTCKFNIGEIFRLVNNGLGSRLAPGVLGANYSVRSFIEELNYCVGDLALETNLEHRLYILTPEGWERYVKVSLEEGENGLVRIDPQGQSPVSVVTNSGLTKIWMAGLTRAPIHGDVLTQLITGATMRVLYANHQEDWIVGTDLNTGVWDTLAGHTFTSDNAGGIVMAGTPLLPTRVLLNYPSETTNLGFQYELCTGEGVNPNFAGLGVQSGTPSAPDSFPKIYLPAECDIEQAFYGTWNATFTAYYPPAGKANQKNVSDMQPFTPFLVDMRQVGYSTGDPTSAYYPTADQKDSYFIDLFMIYALRLLNYNVGTDYGIPNSNDEYLNSTWATILGLTDATMMGGGGTFEVDNVQYTVAVTLSGSGGPHTFTITNGLEVFTYVMNQSERPWQTVATNSDRWGGLFTNNKTIYVAFNDLRLRLPDDVIEIEYVWKIPKDSYYRDVADHVADGFTLTANTDNESLMYNRMDYANHYFSVTETPFTRAKMHQTLYGKDAFDGAGYYIQNGQQLRIIPPTSDPVAVMCRAMPDKLDPTMAITDFDQTYIEVPGISTRILVSKMLYWHNITSSGSSQNALLFKADYMEALEELKKRFIGRGSQNRDNAQQTQRMPSRETVRHKAFGSLQLGEPGEY